MMKILREKIIIKLKNRSFKMGMSEFCNRWCGLSVRGLKKVKLGEILNIISNNIMNNLENFINFFLVNLNCLNKSFSRIIISSIEDRPLSLIKIVFWASLKFLTNFNVKQVLWSFLRPCICVYPVIPYRDELGDFTWGWFFTVVAAAGPCVMLILWWYTAILYTKRGKEWSWYNHREKFLRFVILVTIVWGIWSTMFYLWFFFVYDPASYYDIIRGYYRDGTEVVPGQWPKKRGW